MARCALVDADGRVINVIIAEPGWAPSSDMTTIDITNHPEVDPSGWRYDAGKFLPPSRIAAKFASGQLSITIPTPPTTPPTAATVHIITTDIPVSLSGSPLGGSVPIDVHPSAAVGSIPCRVSAPGCIDAQLDLGNATTPNDDLQVIAPASTGGKYIVAPQHKAWVRQWAFGGGVDQMVERMVAALQDLYTITSILAQVLGKLVVPTLSATTYTPLSLTADEQAALQDMQQHLLPYLGIDLAGLLATEQYGEAKGRVRSYAAAAKAYAEAVASIPNLT